MCCLHRAISWSKRLIYIGTVILCSNSLFQMVIHGNSDNIHRVAKSDFKSFKSCENNYVFPGQMINSTARTVRSEIECASFCNGNSLCSAYNIIKIVNNSLSLKSCEILSNSAQNCKDLEARPFSKYKFLFKTNSNNGNSDSSSGDSNSNNGNSDSSSGNSNSGNSDSSSGNSNSNSGNNANGNSQKDSTDTSTSDSATIAATKSTAATTPEATTTQTVTTTMASTAATPKTTTTPTTTATTTTTTHKSSTAVPTTTMTFSSAAISTSTHPATSTSATTTATATTSAVTNTISSSTTSTTTPSATTAHTTSSAKTTTAAATSTSTTPTTSTATTSTTRPTTSTTSTSTSTSTTPTTSTSTTSTTRPTTSTTSTSTTPTTSTATTSTTRPTTSTISTSNPPTTSTATTSTTRTTTSTSSLTTTTSPAATTTSSSISCSSGWTIVSSTNQLSELIAASQNGSSIIVQFNDASSKRTWRSVAREYAASSTEFCVKLNVGALTDSWKILGDTSQWIFREICTGATMDEYYIDGVIKKKTVSVTWYYRRSPTPGVDTLVNLNNNKIIQGDTNVYQQLVKQGAGVNVLVEDTNNGLGKKDTTAISQDYEVYMNPFVILINDDSFGAMNVLSFAKSTSKPYLNVKSFSTLGTDYNQNYDLDTLKNILSSQTENKHSWMLDTCWTQVYPVTSTLTTTKASTPSLLSAVRAGKRIKVSVTEMNNQVVYAEADQIVVTPSDVVVAQIISIYSKDLKIDKDGIWYLYFIYSSGKQCRYQVAFSGASLKGPECSDVTITWFAETRSPEAVFQTDSAGKVMSGSKSNLQAVGDLRVKVELPNDYDLERYLTVETVEIGSSQDISALSMRNLKTSSFSDNLLRLDSSCEGTAYLVTTESKVTTRYWRPGKLTSDYAVEKSANVTWYLTR